MELSGEIQLPSYRLISSCEVYSVFVCMYMRVYVCKLGHYLAAFICLILNLVTSLTCMHVCEWIRPSLHATICQWPDHNHTVIVQTAMVPQLCRSHTTISLQLHSNHMKIMKPLHCNYTEIIQQ